MAVVREERAFREFMERVLEGIYWRRDYAIEEIDKAKSVSEVITILRHTKRYYRDKLYLAKRKYPEYYRTALDAVTSAYDLVYSRGFEKMSELYEAKARAYWGT